MSQLILQPFFRFSYVTGFYLRLLASRPLLKTGVDSTPETLCENTLDNGFRPTDLCYKSNIIVTNLSNFTSICFLDVYLVCHGGGLHNQTSSVTSPTSQLNLQPFRRFNYVTDHSPTLPLIHLRHSSFSNPSVALPTSQLIFQPFRCFTYVTVHSPALLSLLLRHRFSLTSPDEPPMSDRDSFVRNR